MNVIINGDVQKFKLDKDSIMLFNEKTLDFFELNNTGSFIWKLIEKEKNINQLIVSFIEEYDVDSGNAEKDINNFLTQLEKEGFVSIKKN